VQAAIVAQANVIAIRLGTRADDNLLAVDPATFNRLGGNQWGQFVAGQAFAELVASALNKAVDDIVSSDPNIELLDHATGAWLLPQRLAIASANINAVDALPLDIDEKVRIEASATISPKPLGAVDVLWGFDLDARVQWIADDVLTDIGLGVIQNKVNEKVAEKLSDPPSGFQETERADDHVSYRASNYMDAPHGDAFTCHVGDVHVDDSGLVVLGSMTFPAPPSAMFTADLPVWGFDGDCNTRNVRQALKPGQVHVVGTDPRVAVYLRAEPKVEPAGTWNSERRLSLPGASPVTLDVVFRRTNAALSGATWVYLYTNVGVRAVNFGAIPPKPPVSEREILARTFDLISQCMAISDRWGMGVLNLRWLVDPPPDDYGLPPVIEWAIAIDDVTEVEAVDIVAVASDGSRRELGRVPVQDGHVVAQVVTTAGETLEISTGVAMAGPAPRVSGRWVTPWSAVEIGDDGRAEVLEPALHRDARQPATPAMVDALESRISRSLEATARAHNLGASTVAVYDRGRLLLGVAGAFVPAVIAPAG
jgi:hypothetical protein